MLRILLLTSVVFIMTTKQSQAQEKDTMLLVHPAEWRYERIEFPLSFAPDIAYEGVEELRFAPGMFDTLAHDYFTYIFTLTIENGAKMEYRALKDFLIEYYRGLSTAVAKSNKLDVDLSAIEVTLKGQKPTMYSAQVTYLDTFNNGRRIMLNMDIQVFDQGDTLYVLALVSPKPPKDEVWQELYKIKTKLKSVRSEFKRQ